MLFRSMMSGLPPLEAIVDHWRQRWEPGEDRPRLALQLGTHGAYVVDSRCGGPTSHALSDDEAAELSRLDGPAEVSSVPADMLETFRVRGWLLEERGRVMSLVC